MNSPSYSISLARVKALQRQILLWYQRNGRHQLPWRQTRDAYKIFVSEVMLQQTQVARVIPKYQAFLKAYPTVQSLARSGQVRLLRLWSGLGYNRRAINLRRAAQQIVSQHHGQFPRTVEVLQVLPGIGPYTARAILIFAFNQNLAAVDTNIRRILISRLKLPQPISASQLQAVADQVLPKGQSRTWHQALMDYGATVATARATGVPSLGRQGVFAGSNRYYRGQIIKLLLAQSGVGLTQRQLTQRLSLPLSQVKQLAKQLAAEGMVELKQTRIRLVR